MKSIFLIIILLGILVSGVIIYLDMHVQKPVQTPILAAQPAMVKQADKGFSNPSGGILNEKKPAPELTGITMWFNLPAGQNKLTLADLRGKVVLVDFWTNQCINCIHTLPHITKWYDTYKDQGFVVIGVHTPELSYEYTAASVQDAIKQYGIHYPVAQDNDYMTWNAYANQYWPSLYLIDKNGVIRRTHFGEEEYTETESAIKTLLSEAKM